MCIPPVRTITSDEWAPVLGILGWEQTPAEGGHQDPLICDDPAGVWTLYGGSEGIFAYIDGGNEPPEEWALVCSLNRVAVDCLMYGVAANLSGELADPIGVLRQWGFEFVIE